jgi:4-oxalmesaconate hydratase
MGGRNDGDQPAVGLAPGDRAKVFELNARRVYPRLDAALAARGR